MALPVATFMTKTQLVHGQGAAATTGQHASHLGIERALVVTDKGIVSSGLLDRIGESLRSAGIAYDIFDEVREDATVQLMHQGALHAVRSECNGIIALGGGSALCAGRGIALEAANGKMVSEYEGFNRYATPPLPVICVPTTAGTGAEVSVGFVVHDDERERVFAPRGDDLQPQVSILDPLLLKTCPAHQMIYSGLDALAHAIDAIWAKTATPMTDALAYEAIRLIMTNLRRAALTEDVEAKDLQLLASTMAGVACSNAGMGIAHGMTLYYRFRVPHGYQAAMFLPHAMKFNMPVCEARLARIALDIGENPKNQSSRSLAELALRRLKELYQDLGFPRKFDEAEFPVGELSYMAADAARNSLVKNNARQASKADLRVLYEASLAGWNI